MKKMYLVLVAVTLAISFSAFTTRENPPETVWYNIGAGWQPYENPCPAGSTLFCKVDIGQQTDVQLYRNQDINQPVRYDEAR
ncbi:MAG: hypothetical protein HZA79_01085 [Sphingobacteriales bacterium]|nr:hypothetical protein [Sphingobacteriales bacterium]